MSHAMQTLSERILGKIKAGLLPTAKPLKIWAQFGFRSTCCACDQPILPAQTELEFGEETPDRIPFRFHIGCLALWDAVCARPMPGTI